MSEVPSELKYTREHEWVRVDDDSTVTVGITDHAQAELGDLVFVEVPETGTRFEAGDPVAVVESVKAASDIYSPLTGEVVEANEDLGESPELINSDPYGEGWIYRLRPDSMEALDELLGADDYEAFADAGE
jgi:glycine cleavage system H protein